MSLKNKINQRLQDSSNWIMDTPESLVILMLMATGIAFLFFGVFSVAFGFGRRWFLMVFFGVFSFLGLKKFISIIKMVKKLGLKNALGGFSARGFVWHKDKDGGKEDGNNGSIKADEICDEQDAERDGAIGKEVRDIYCKPE